MITIYVDEKVCNHTCHKSFAEVDFCASGKASKWRKFIWRLWSF